MLICYLTLSIGVTSFFVGLGRKVPDEAVGEVDAVIAKAEGDPDGDLGTQTNVPLEAYYKDFASL